MRLISVTRVWTALTLVAVLFGFSHRSYADTISVISSAVSTDVLGPSPDSFSLDSGPLTVDTGSGPSIFRTGESKIDESYIGVQVVLFLLEDSQTSSRPDQGSVTDAADDFSIFAGGPFNVGDQIFTGQPFTVEATTVGGIPAELIGTVVPQVTADFSSLILLGTGLLAAGFVGILTINSSLLVPHSCAATPFHANSVTLCNPAASDGKTNLLNVWSAV